MPSVVDQVRQAIRERDLFAPGQTVVVAVSGGADSLCLLHVLWCLREELGLRLHVAHLDHRLRADEGAADARFVAEVAASLGLPASIGARDVAAYRLEHRQTLEEAAREVRYDFLRQVATKVQATALVTGHTSDDNVETILLHWLRGAGLAGMRGMAASQGMGTAWDAATWAEGRMESQVGGGPGPALRLVRPLLGLTRAQTEAYCLDQGLAFRQDASNQDECVLRNRLRLRLLPELERYNPNLRATLLRTAAAAAGDYDYLHGQVIAVWPQVVLPPPAGRDAGSDSALPAHPRPAVRLNRAAFQALPPSLQRGVLREGLERLWGGWQDFGWSHLESARQAVATGRVGTVVHLPHGLALAVDYQTATLAWAVSPSAGAQPQGDAWGDEEEPAFPLLARAGDLPVSVPGETLLPDTPWRLVVAEIPRAGQPLEASGLAQLVDAGAVGRDLLVRRPRPGDRFQPMGMSGTKKLQDLFVDQKVPRRVRGRLPVLVAGERILWVAGRYLADWARVRSETERLFSLSFLRDV